MMRAHHLLPILLSVALATFADSSTAARPKARPPAPAQKAPAPSMLSVLRRSITSYEQVHNVRWQLVRESSGMGHRLRTREDVKLRDSRHWLTESVSQYMRDGKPTTKHRRVGQNGTNGFLYQVEAKEYCSLTAAQARVFSEDGLYDILRRLVSDPGWKDHLAKNRVEVTTWRGEPVYACRLEFAPDPNPEAIASLRFTVGRRDYLPRYAQRRFTDGGLLDETFRVSHVARGFPDSTFRFTPPPGVQKMKSVPKGVSMLAKPSR